MDPIERPYAGRYVRIEGPDGAGKSTQIRNAYRYAEENNIDVVFVREPGGTVFGLALRNLLLHDKTVNLTPAAEYALFTADRSYLVSSVISPALEAGRTVIGDRGIESSDAYQSAAGKLSSETIWEVGRLFLPEWYLRPDALVFLSLSQEVRRRRMANKLAAEGHDKIEERGLEYGDRVHEAYIRMGKAFSHATEVDAELPPEKLFEQLKPLLFGPEHR